MAKHRIFIVVTLLIVLGCGLLSCSKTERSMRRDRHWAKEYLNSLGREHYNMVLCAAAQSKKITRIPGPKHKDYSFADISNSRSVETIKLLSRMGLNLDYEHEGKTPLMLATLDKHFAIVQILLQLGANPLMRDDKGKTALNYAKKGSKIATALQEALDNIRSASFDVAQPHKREYSDYAVIEESSDTDSLAAADTLNADISYQYLARLVQNSNRSKQLLISADKDVELAPSLRTAVHPTYPEGARKKNLSGRVVMEVDVLPNGRVAEAKVTHSDNAVFNAAALSAVKASRFMPAQKGGFPVKAKSTIEARFEATAR